MDDGALGIEHLKNGRCSALGIEHLNKTINILSNSVNGNIRTVIVERSLIGISEDYYSFIPNQMCTIPLITAIGQSQTFAYHKAQHDLIINIQYKENCTDWNYRKSDQILTSLQAFICNNFSINNIFQLTYTHSNEANPLYIECDDDLKDAIKYAERENVNELTIFVIEYITKNIPLHRFTVEDIINSITKWLLNDNDYKKYRIKTEKIFHDNELNGQKIINLSAENITKIIKEQMLEFVTSETLDIMVKHIIRWKDNINDIKMKTAKQIGCSAFSIPFKKLINVINDEKMDGNKIIDVFNDETNDIFTIETGWKKSEIYQIKLMLLRHKTFTKTEFITNMNKIVRKFPPDRIFIGIGDDKREYTY